MYAYDDVLAEFQEYQLDLRPKLIIAASNNAVGLQFDSLLGLNYILQSSTDFLTWQPVQSFPGTGGAINELIPMAGPVGFFRLHCAPSTPPVLSAISAAGSMNSMTLTFNEPVNSSTAMNPANYFVGSQFGGIAVQNVQLVGSRSVALILAQPLMPGGNYFLGVMGVSDLAGNVMASTTSMFNAAALQTPCDGGTLLVRQAYSECNPDGFWHVIEDDYYQCPDGSVQKFRVADTKTTDPCGKAVPSPVGLLCPTSADVAATCQSSVLIGQVTILECVGGMWSASTYLLYECLGGTKYLSGPVQNVPVNPATPCSQPPPPPAG
jgi:hypothetical protein